jgi:transcription termination factor Rho
MNAGKAMEFLIDKTKKAKTNDEFFEAMSPKKNGNGFSSK